MNKSESISELSKALNSFQGKLRAVKKDAVNPFFRSHYATLDAIWEAIREPLSTSGLAITQTLGQTNDGKTLLDTTLLHTSGEWLQGNMLVNPVKDDPQGLGSAISYARRYSLCAMLGVVADEDDDANIATKPQTRSEPKPKEGKSGIIEALKKEGIEAQIEPEAPQPKEKPIEGMVDSKPLNLKNAGELATALKKKVGKKFSVSEACVAMSVNSLSEIDNLDEAFNTICEYFERKGE